MLVLSLNEKVAVVTGASRGLGAAAARALAEAGAHLALLGRSAPSLEARRAELVSAAADRRQKILAMVADVSDEASVASAAAQVMGEFGRVDILVNNAGTAEPAPLLKAPLPELRRTIDVNLVGVMLCARAFGAHMVAQQHGVIINLGSIAGLIGEPDISAYAATKGAVLAFTRALAVEWARHGVRVNAIAPGYFRTDLNMVALDDAEIGPKIVRQIPLRRVGNPEEIGPLIVYLASDAAAFMTGSTVVIDGGQTAR